MMENIHQINPEERARITKAIQRFHKETDSLRCQDYIAWRKEAVENDPEERKAIPSRFSINQQFGTFIEARRAAFPNQDVDIKVHHSDEDIMDAFRRFFEEKEWNEGVTSRQYTEWAAENGAPTLATGLQRTRLSWIGIRDLMLRTHGDIPAAS